MIFPDQQWSWRQADGAVQYGFVSNAVHICRADQTTRTALVKIPTEFFQLLPIAFPREALTHAALVGVSLYLDEIDDAWVMGAETLDGKHFIDLWPYTTARLPVWATLALAVKA